MAVLTAALSSPGSTTSITWLFFPRESIHSALIVREAGVHGIGPDLAMALVAQESGFEEWAKSGSGAHGLMQVMPRTAFGYPGCPGECMDLPLALSDTSQNIRCGLRVLKNRLREFKGDEVMALQAYHDGASGARWMRWQGGFQFASKESREYVPRVLARRPVYTLLYPHH